MPASAHAPVLDQLRALSHDIRFEIVQLLAEQEHCVCELEELLGLAQPKISYHLGILRAANLVLHEQRGKNVYHLLNHAQLSGLGSAVLSAVYAGKPAREATQTGA